MDFPIFDGENPRLWKDRCELYFEIFGVCEALKPRFAALNFKGADSSWLQTLELRGRVSSWEQLHMEVCAHFDRDQYQNHMRQLDALRQTGSVAEYYQRFEQLSRRILLYNASYDDVFFVTRFLHGLKDEISSPIALHRPPNVDTASALALLQEQELEHARQKRSFRHESRESMKAGSRVFTTNDNGKNPLQLDDMKKTDKSSVDEKWSAIKAYLKANNLCYTCVENWTGRAHKCPDQVPVQMI